ncbi:glycosyltransferase [Kocuria rosea]|uniref:glycosyltransferase n=1 Tax=Kocuria rosea TaxID=1275 RepID=UPI001558AE3C|nr:glycosyltransferase [Kocuria rosea]
MTNLMPPYRISLWEAVGKMTRLRVALLEGDDQEVLSSDRSSEWATRSGSNFSAVDLRVKTWHRYAGNMHLGLDVRHMVELVRQADVMLLGGWESPVYVQMLVLSKMLGKPVVLFHESTEKSARHKHGPVVWLKRMLFRRMDAVVVPGVASHELVSNLGVSEEKIFEGFNAVDMEFFRRNPDVGGDRGSEICAGGHRFLFLGRLRKDKRIDSIITAFSCMRGDGDRLSIVGSGSEYEDLRDLVNVLDLGDAVEFLGLASYEELPAVLQAHDTLVLASGHDVWGLVVNEALASGLHVVVSDHCGVWQSVREMRGVYVWHEEMGTRLEDLMQRSSDDWSGFIAEPEILEMTNERFAGVFVEGFYAALGYGSGDHGEDRNEGHPFRLSDMRSNADEG